jgi:formamidopyrimidine-DNA glycosylase
MPELPDILLYLHALRPRILGRRLETVRLASPFVLRSVDPPLASVHGRRVVGLHRLGKRIAMELDGELFLVVHLMIAGRFRWKEAAPDAGDDARRLGTGRPAIPGKVGLLALDFENGTLLLTEAGTQKRASLHIVAGREALAEHDRGGLEVLDATFEAFDHALRQESHTLKRTLTDPRLFSGIGNAYSDEILHAARLSPFKGSTSLTDEESRRLFDATRRVLQHWTTRLQEESGERFPEKVTAFREGMAVHGRYGEPCPDCGSPVQRIVYAANEANYCATCQTGGRPLADRALSRLLREDWVAFAAARLRRAKTGDAATEHLPRPKAGDAATARLRRDEPGDASRPAAKPGRRAARSRRAKPPRDE